MSYCLNPDCQNPQNSGTEKYCSCCGATLLVGDRYRSLNLIGRGGFGRTFLAVDEYKPSQPRCVIKQFFPQVQGTDATEKAAELFMREAEQLDQLGSHSQIPELLAYLTQNNYQYLVQEFIEGQNLDWELKHRGNFREDRIIQILCDLLKVLSFIHQRQVIHRDIKPENIIKRASNNQLVLVDFGAAKSATETALKRTGTAIGSVAYIPPEQMIGKATFASDIYSLGATCLHLLAGVSPLDMYDIVEETWHWRQYLTSPVSGFIGQILDKMVRPRIKYRYQLVEEVLNDLNSHPTQLLTGQPSQSTASVTIPYSLSGLSSQPQNVQVASNLNFTVPNLSSVPTQILPTWKCVRTLAFHRGRVNAIVICSDGQTLVSCSDDKRIIVWNLKTGKYTQNLPVIALVLSMAIDLDERVIISSGIDKTITIRNLDLGSISCTLLSKYGNKLSHSGAIYSVALSPQNHLLASCSDDKMIRLWNWKTGKLIHTFQGHLDTVWSVAFSSDGETLVSCSADCTIKLWDINTRTLQRELRGHSGSVNTVAIAPDNQTLVSGSKDGTLKIWKLATGELINSLDGHSNSILSVAIDRNGQTCASGSKDSTIKIWNLDRGELQQTLSGHSEPVKSVAFTPDGKTLVSGSWDTTIKIWRFRNYWHHHYARQSTINQPPI